MQLELGLFDRKIYLIALELNQPFTIDDWTSAVQAEHPTWTKKNIQNRVKNMLRQNLLSKHRKGFKSYYSCLVTRDEFLAAEFVSTGNIDINNNPFMLGL
ncbi:hypothetical protein [Clostridium cellulovorans]|uniref:Uncharacterized protein n=1 Tax=Clostridium cellulovorans (strain ATCC 35296 / DSM 3052 / OCM 3 / 743B) TaxID=573061 RepID=D9SLN6_CLOC7|nr:hypothetical protein [Clostridium cellulovorans]ADL53673.1 hypothetical protein Clocel_4010 [Clostridium cellulovorans 743B]